MHSLGFRATSLCPQSGQKLQKIICGLKMWHQPTLQVSKISRPSAESKFFECKRLVQHNHLPEAEANLITRRRSIRHLNLSCLLETRAIVKILNKYEIRYSLSLSVPGIQSTLRLCKESKSERSGCETIPAFPSPTEVFYSFNPAYRC